MFRVKWAGSRLVLTVQEETDENLNMMKHLNKNVMIYGLPAPMNDPFAITTLPPLLRVTPRFSKVPPNTVYTVAICNTVALRAALSDWQIELQVWDEDLYYAEL